MAKFLVTVLALLGAQALVPCEAAVKCGQLTCPGGFVVTTLEGHACPYCMPNAEMQVYGKSTLQHVLETKDKPNLCC